MGTYPAAHGHAAVAAAGTIAALLRTDANEVDRHGVTRARVDLVAGAGLLGIAGPQELGGGGAPPAVVREVTELIAGACGTTWFVVTQHRSVMEAAVATTNPTLRDHWAAALAAGDALGAVAFAHLRRPGAPTVRATAVDGGWRVDGSLDWVTSWGLADVLLLMAETEDGQVVQALLGLPRDIATRAGLEVGGEVPLAAMSGTHTVAVRLDGLLVRDDEVAAIVPKAAWLADDATRTPNAPPQSFGLTRAVVAALHDLGQRRRDGELEELAEVLAHETTRVRADAYALVDDVAPGERVDERLALRAHAHELAVRASAAYVAASAGSAMRLNHDGQRWAREALFHLVQAQTADTRGALVARWSRTQP